MIELPLWPHKRELPKKNLKGETKKKVLNYKNFHIWFIAKFGEILLSRIIFHFGYITKLPRKKIKIKKIMRGETEKKRKRDERERER